VTEALIICRFAHFISAMALFGASFFIAALAPARLATMLHKAMRRISFGAIAIATISCIAWLMLEAGEMGDGWNDAIDVGTISAVLGGTAFGLVWIGRLALIFVLLGVLTLLPSRWILVAALSGLSLASLGLIDHAAMHEGGLGAFERVNQAMHLVCGGFWLGSLAPLLICLPNLKNPALKNEATSALRRFSGLGHFAVAGVLMTGVVNVLVILGHWPVDFASPYQLLLATKIALVAIMVLLAIFNRYFLVPRVATAAASLRSLSTSTVAEIVLGACVLGLVSIFALLEPK
jgi:copper resistance protein D